MDGLTLDELLVAPGWEQPLYFFFGNITVLLALLPLLPLLPLPVAGALDAAALLAGLTAGLSSGLTGAFAAGLASALLLILPVVAVFCGLCCVAAALFLVLTAARCAAATGLLSGFLGSGLLGTVVLLAFLTLSLSLFLVDAILLAFGTSLATGGFFGLAASLAALD